MSNIYNGFRITSGENYYSISFKDDGRHDGHALKPCSECGGLELEIRNTHAPAYWVECLACGARLRGEYDENAPCTTEREALEAHNRALLSAVEEWNLRR
ncbi:hypothetical protein [Pantoea vagans]|uniref:hypothetical protein n=1 Tax=Pantoea vagans TaxID=470934 RepID=UPI00065FB35D|nr:hypothetical protein [Pantoea vagans]